jgi:hypothetical protein
MSWLQLVRCVIIFWYLFRVGEQHVVVVARAVIRSERARASALAWRRRDRPSPAPPCTGSPRTAAAALVTSSPRPPLWKVGGRRWGWGEGWRGWATRPTPPPTTPTTTATPTTRHSTSTRGPSGASTTHTRTRYWLYKTRFCDFTVPQGKLCQRKFLVQKYHN